MKFPLSVKFPENLQRYVRRYKWLLTNLTHEWP